MSGTKPEDKGRFAASHKAGDSLITRLWRYQAERFPLAQHGMLTVIFAAATGSFAASAYGKPLLWGAVALGALLALAQFLLLRIADEHKDFDTDKTYRPYRAVPRGLVSLRTLRAIGVVAALIMLVAVIATRSFGLLVILAVLWSYFALMSAEFFASDWLTKRPVLYLGSHMVLLPILAWLVAGTQIEAGGDPALSLPARAPLFLVAVLFLGVVLELGRKIRATPDEERGVETYSVLWGHERARIVWIVSAVVAAIAAILAIMLIGGSLVVALVLVGAGLALLIAAYSRFAPEAAGAGKRIETASSLFVLSLLAALGAAPPLGASL